MVRQGAERAVVSGSGRAGGLGAWSARGRGGLAPLAGWAGWFAGAGAVRVRNRLSVLERLRPEVLRRYRAVAGSEAEVALEYRAAWMEGPPGGEEEIREALAAALVKARPRDLERGVSTAGPHRDDLEVLLDGADARGVASQGEQRSLALSLRMAERDLVAESRGRTPSCCWTTSSPSLTRCGGSTWWRWCPV